MGSFNWLEFLNGRDIEYVTAGRNISKGNIALPCPFCNQTGDPDPSEHMNISLHGKGWACWRNAAHRGTSKARLVQVLANVSWAEACDITGGDEAPLLVNEDYLARLQELYPSERLTRMAKLAVPKDWKPLITGTGTGPEIIYNHMKEVRRYPKPDAKVLAGRFDLQYSYADKWEKRIIFPVRDEQARLVNYTGRTVNPRATIRYKTANSADAIMGMGKCLLDLPRLMRTEGEALIVVEGPFDALRISWVGEPLGIYATCTFTANITEDQGALLQRITGFKRKLIVYDREAMIQALRAKEMVPEAELGWIPAGVKDPGELTPQQALSLCREWTLN